MKPDFTFTFPVRVALPVIGLLLLLVIAAAVERSAAAVAFLAVVTLVSLFLGVFGSVEFSHKLIDKE